jgi:hypothetical protein
MFFLFNNNTYNTIKLLSIILVIVLKNVNGSFSQQQRPLIENHNGIISTHSINSIFKIGGLLPKTDRKDEDNGDDLNNNDAFTVQNALEYAERQLSSLFKSIYGCKIDLKQQDTKCHVSYGTRSFFEFAKDTSSTLMAFGGSCDSTIKPIAESAQFFNMTYVSFQLIKIKNPLL